MNREIAGQLLRAFDMRQCPHTMSNLPGPICDECWVGWANAEIERLLADEREPMECGHPRAYLKLTNEEERLLLDYQAAPCSGAETSHELRQKWQKCSACAERDKARVLAEMIQEGYDEDDEEDSRPAISFWERIHKKANEVIRQLDLTKDLAPSTEEGKGGE
ncbi:hypothetical protein LCGC14_3059710 [marine sediment metagenome]|uniref:Uncharacterized protein n=1 Tax=marine sediment metagenome TaxID=412755 RepID=A0A0F8WJV5_9ZZZZ